MRIISADDGYAGKLEGLLRHAISLSSDRIQFSFGRMSSTTMIESSAMPAKTPKM